MQATFDFQTSMALALGADEHPHAPLAWVEIAGVVLLAAREDLLPGAERQPGDRLN